MTQEYTLTLHDQDGLIHVYREDLLKYAGQTNVIAAALMMRVCKLAFEKLSPDAPVERRQLYWQLGFPGSGLVDCVEMISHAVRDGRCLQQPVFDHPHAPFSILGQFVFTISYQGKTIEVWPSSEVFDDEFRNQVKIWQEQADSNERQAYLDYKARKVKQIITLSDHDLLNFVWK